MKKTCLLLAIVLISLGLDACAPGVYYVSFYKSITITNGTNDRWLEIWVNGEQVSSKMDPGKTKTIKIYIHRDSRFNVLAKAFDEEGNFSGTSQKKAYLGKGNYGKSNSSVTFLKRNFRQ